MTSIPYPNEAIPILSPQKSDSLHVLHLLAFKDSLPFYKYMPLNSLFNPSWFLYSQTTFFMAPLLQKPRVTEIQVRMDCIGCVQRIKKSLNAISGINDIYIDFPEQKLTIIGWADPDKIIKAIRRTGKIPTICSRVHVEGPTQSPSQPTEEAPEDTKQHEQPPEDEDGVSEQSQNNLETKDVGVGEDDETHEDPPNYRNRYGFGHSPPLYATHSYNTYQPSPYVTQYEYLTSPNHTHYTTSEDYYYNHNANSNLTSIFSDENPNSCTIV